MDNATFEHWLDLCHRGQHHFDRLVHGLSDEELDEPSALPNWSRRHVIAHVALNAKGFCNLVTWAETGVETPMYPSREVRDGDIDRASTLAAEDLRALSHDNAAELDARWRAMPIEARDNEVANSSGRFPVAQSVWLRARELWIHAVDLGVGASFEDLPGDLVDGLLDEFLVSWEQRREAGEDIPLFVLTPNDRTIDRPVDAPQGSVVVRGTASQLLAWATGRPAEGLLTDSGDEVTAPRWI